MSTGLELVPMALALGAVLAARRARIKPVTTDAGLMVTIPTRMRDEGLLARSLQRTGEDCGIVDGVLAGAVDGLPIALRRTEDGTYDAHFAPDTAQERAQAAVEALDTAYCQDLQRDVHSRVVSSAPSLGLRVLDESRESDGTVVVTLQAVGEQ